MKEWVIYFSKKNKQVSMKATNTIDELFTHLRLYFQKDSITKKYADEKPPLRSELFTHDQMVQHAKNLAVSHELSYEQLPEQLLGRLSENEEVINEVTKLLQQSVKDKKPYSPREWLLDNFYLIEEQIKNRQKIFTQRIQQKAYRAW